MSERPTNKPIELSIEIETQDVEFGYHLFEPKEKEVVSGKTQKTIGEGVTIRYEGEEIFLAEEVPTIVKIAAYIGEKVVFPIASTILANYLYDKLKNRRDNKLKINGTPVEINAEKIGQVIIVILKQEKEEYEQEKTYNFF